MISLSSVGVNYCKVFYKVSLALISRFNCLYTKYRLCARIMDREIAEKLFSDQAIYVYNIRKLTPEVSLPWSD